MTTAGADLVAEHRTPLEVRLVRGHDGAAAGVALGDELEYEAGGGLVQGQVAHLVDAEQGPHPELGQALKEAVLLLGVGDRHEERLAKNLALYPARHGCSLGIQRGTLVRKPSYSVPNLSLRPGSSTITTQT